MFETNEEEVTTHKHERKNLCTYNKPNSHAARRSQGVSKNGGMSEAWCGGLDQIPFYSFLGGPSHRENFYQRGGKTRAYASGASGILLLPVCWGFILCTLRSWQEVLASIGSCLPVEVFPGTNDRSRTHVFDFFDDRPIAFPCFATPDSMVIFRYYSYREEYMCLFRGEHQCLDDLMISRLLWLAFGLPPYLIAKPCDDYGSQVSALILSFACVDHCCRQHSHLIDVFGLRVLKVLVVGKIGQHSRARHPPLS